MKTAIAVKVIFKVVSQWFLVNLLKELHLLVTHMHKRNSLPIWESRGVVSMDSVGSMDPADFLKE